MALLWAKMIMSKRKSFDEVPRLLKEKTKEILTQNGKDVKA